MPVDPRAEDANAYRPPADLYPFESHWLDLDGGRLHYLDEGPRDAPVVLMVHGNPTWSFYYRNLVKALRGRYRCIVPDHMGCGLSDKPDDEHYPYQLERRIDDIDALMNHLGLAGQPLTLVVHDWGGMIGFGWATRAGAELRQCVVLNTAAFPMPESKRFPLALWFAGRTSLGAFAVRAFNAFSGGAARIGFKQPVSPEVRAGYVGPYDSWANRIATVRFVQDIPLKPGDRGYDIVERTEQDLSRYRQTPTMIAWGLRDFVFDHHFLARWEQILPHAEVERHENFGHYVLEDGGEALVERITHFIERHEPGADAATVAGP